MSEHDEQTAVFDWALLREGKHPELKNLFAIPNGAYKSKASAVKFKREGLKSGVPDIMLAWPLAIGNVIVFCGLFIEMKIKGNKPTFTQLAWREKLEKAGYQVSLCYSAEEAIRVICSYLCIECDLV